MRIHLGWANFAIPGLHLLSKNGAPGDVMTPGVLPAIDDHARHHHGLLRAHHRPLRAFGNFFLPIQVGAEDMPFPHFNMMSFWVTFVAFLVLVASFFVRRWTDARRLDAVCSTERDWSGCRSWRRARAWSSGQFRSAIFCIGQLLGSLNFITTTLDMRCKGMSLMRLPLSAWAWFITSLMGLTAFAVLMPACILLILDHVAGTSFFIPSNLVDQRSAVSRTPADRLCCGSTCSGSSDILRSTSQSCPAWASFRTF